MQCGQTQRCRRIINCLSPPPEPGSFIFTVEMMFMMHHWYPQHLFQVLLFSISLFHINLPNTLKSHTTSTLHLYNVRITTSKAFMKFSNLITFVGLLVSPCLCLCLIMNLTSQRPYPKNTTEQNSATGVRTITWL